MSLRLGYGYLLEFRLAGYGWHQRSEFNASFSTYRFFSGMQVLHALCRFENFFNAPGAAYQPGERLLELERHELTSLGVPRGRRWASPAVPAGDQTLAVDRQVYNSRPEPVVGWPQDTVFPVWGSLEMMKPFPPDDVSGEAYPFRALYLAENQHDIRAGDVYWIGKKRVAFQVVRVEMHELREAERGDTCVHLEVPIHELTMFESYQLYDATGRGLAIVKGHFEGPAVVCGEAAVPTRLLEHPALEKR